VDLTVEVACAALSSWVHSFWLDLQVHRLFQSEFSTECDLELPPSVFTIFLFPEGHPLTAYILFPVFPSLLSFFL